MPRDGVGVIIFSQVILLDFDFSALGDRCFLADFISGAKDCLCVRIVSDVFWSDLQTIPPTELRETISISCLEGSIIIAAYALLP